MKYWIGILSLLAMNINSVFAEGVISKKGDEQIAIVFLGLIMIAIIVLILFRRQKRRFND